MSHGIAFEIKLDVPYETAITNVTEALKKEGFGILTQIDVKATLKEKLNVDFKPYSILGACNPPLAHRALTRNLAVGLMLPCNITVEGNTEGGSFVRIADPETMMLIGDFESDPELKEVANLAKQKLAKVIKALK